MIGISTNSFFFSNTQINLINKYIPKGFKLIKERDQSKVNISNLDNLERSNNKRSKIDAVSII
jgi:hypothetical protein